MLRNSSNQQKKKLFSKIQYQVYKFISCIAQAVKREKFSKVHYQFVSYILCKCYFLARAEGGRIKGECIFLYVSLFFFQITDFSCQKLLDIVRFLPQIYDWEQKFGFIYMLPFLILEST
eukprot:TRINITY_DN1877_c0_g1_i16.p7 TRINITY_DN1877_c0_g1~~TRINITY_DN1877_c0_g1_i16.p7  ORF type:complete len:119 (-),score=3.22 TRINITY_DN1877_c0_g1_i16:500-856(-)